MPYRGPVLKSSRQSFSRSTSCSFSFGVERLPMPCKARCFVTPSEIQRSEHADEQPRCDRENNACSNVNEKFLHGCACYPTLSRTQPL